MCLSQDNINNKKTETTHNFNTSCVQTLSNNFGAPIEYKMLSEVDSKKICSKVKKLTKQ